MIVHTVGMTDTITLTGLVATTPRFLTTSEGLRITSFRLASAQRRFDRSKQRWVDGETNWYTITSFRQLAINVSGSISKGDRIITTGRLRIRDWVSGERTGTNIDIEADAVGHDLSWGTASFTRTIVTASAEPVAPGAQPSEVGEESPTGADADGATPAEQDISQPVGETEADKVPVPF